MVFRESASVLKTKMAFSDHLRRVNTVNCCRYKECKDKLGACAMDDNSDGRSSRIRINSILLCGISF